MSVYKELKSRAIKEYNKKIEKIPHTLEVYDIADGIMKDWICGDRKARKDGVFGLPRYVFLWLGKFDRLSVEVNFFIEEIEERYGLEFSEARIDDDAIVYRYRYKGLGEALVVFIYISENNCRVVKKEVEPTVFKNYQTQIICNE